MKFVGSGLRLAAADYQTAADRIGVEVATVRAVVQVEAAGRGFDNDNRPKILFEPHIFYRLLGKGAKRDRAVFAGLAYSKWGAKPYPKTSGENYTRLAKAMKIDADCALRSCSWGLPQIMGDNFKDAGFPSAAAMVEAFKTGEKAQLAAMMDLIDAWDIEDDLQRHDWPGFARRYNGPGFERNGYHTKLATAYASFAKGQKPKTAPDVPTEARLPPLPRPRPGVSPDTAADAVIVGAGGDEPIAVDDGTQKDDTTVAGPFPPIAGYDAELEQTQALLIAAGYPVGEVDGRWGTMTRSALLGFKADWNASDLGADFTIDTTYGQDVQDALAIFRRPVSPERAATTEKDLKAAGDPAVSFLSAAKKWLFGLFGFGVVGGVTDNTDAVSKLEEATGTFGRIKSALAPLGGLMDFLVSHWWIIAIVVSGAGYLWVRPKIKALVETYQKGLRA